MINTIHTKSFKEEMLWRNILDYDLDDDENDFMFSDRLARENGWTKWFTLQAIEEYKKFIFLICVTNESLAPSEAVDQVWHLHLLYTKSYWKEFCGDVLKREIHHVPTRGGPEEHDKFADWYARTLFHYRRFFDSPPSNIWPHLSERFRPSRFCRIDLKRFWIIKKPKNKI